MSKASSHVAPRAATRAERRKAQRAQRSQAERKTRKTSIWRGPVPFVVAGVAIAAALGWSVLSSQQRAAPPLSGANAAQILATVTSVPQSVLDQVGFGGVPDPLQPTSLALLRGPSGKPVVIYVGADYCPFCASERWSLVVALSRFGTFRDVGLTTSSSTDVYPDTPTFSFRGSSYSSDLIEFSSVETADRFGKPLASPDALQQGALDRSDPKGSVPFVSIADRFVAVGSGYPPDVIKGKTWSEIAAALSDPSSPVARAVLGNADRITAAICKAVPNAPASVCNAPAVKGSTSP